MAPNNRAYIGESLAIDMSNSCHVLAHPVSFNLIPKSLHSVEAMYIRFASYLFENSVNEAIVLLFAISVLASRGGGPVLALVLAAVRGG